MERFVWDDKLKIGVEVVDKAHAKLFRITNRLLEASEDMDISPNAYREGIKYLEAYSVTHFSEEEAFMRSIQYKGYTHHKKIHDNFREKTLLSLKRDLDLSGYSRSAVQRFVGIMNNWLKEHIMMEDQAIVGKGALRRPHNQPTQISIISRAVDRATKEILQTDARLVNEDYKGQNIGEGFYCRQHFDIDGGARVQILLGAERILLLRGVNRMPGMQELEEEEMTDDIILPVFEHLVQSISRLFRVEKMYEFGKDKLLTKEAFRSEFMKGYPCRLLFGTRAGNFIFCYRSWRIRKQ